MFHAHWFPFHMNFARLDLVLVRNRTYVILSNVSRIRASRTDVSIPLADG